MIEVSIIHIPRSGGMSLMHTIARMIDWNCVLGVYGNDQIDKPENVLVRPEYRVAIGHYGFSWFQGAKKYIVLRNPIMRVLSLYSYAIEHPNIAPWFLSDRVTLEKFLATCPSANNGLARQLVDKSIAGPVKNVQDSICANLAKERINQCAVYTLNNLDGLVSDLAKEFGTNPVLPEHRNSVSVKTYSGKDIELITQHNELDIMLWSYKGGE